MRYKKGLFGTAKIKRGFRVTEFDKKIPRVWKPNIVSGSLYSELLDAKVKTKVTAAVLRKTDWGGLDHYLLRTPDAKLGSDQASNLKLQVNWLRKQQLADERSQRFNALKSDVAAARKDTIDRVIGATTSSQAVTGDAKQRTEHGGADLAPKPVT